MKWTQVQEEIKDIFSDVKVQKYDDVLEKTKDDKAFNWVLDFEQLTGENYLIAVTKFVFPIDSKKEELRENAFYYLYDLNCKYKRIPFKSIKDLNKKITTILEEEKFGVNLLNISHFLVSAAMTINDYMYQQGIEEYTIYEFSFDENYEIKPCERLELDFKFNINNRADVDMKIKKEGTNNFIFTFTHLDETYEIEEESLYTIEEVITNYITKNF